MLTVNCARDAARSVLGVVASALILLAAGSGATAASDAAKPSWVAIDAAGKKVTFDVIAGWNSNNSALNFNGYFAGDATIVVPVGWTAVFNFGNADAGLPHSLVVVNPYASGNLPAMAGRDQVAIPRAYTRNPESGIAAGETDNFQFTAAAAGDYDLICGALGHAQSGMWIHLSLSPDAAGPGVIIASGAVAGRN
jgi:sulfocyanin